MKALELKRALYKIGSKKNVLIHGISGSGKTRYAWTICKNKNIDRVWYFSIDDGYETGLVGDMYTEEELNKVEIFTVNDTQDRPRAWDLIQRVISSKGPVYINEDGSMNLKANDNTSTFPGWVNMTDRDCVIIDQITQLGISIHNYNLLKGNVPRSSKTGEIDTRGVYAEDASLQSSFLQVIQHTKFPTICLAQTMFEDVDPLKQRDLDKYPSFGSRNFSIQTASYFHNVIYMTIQAKKHIKGSSTTWKDGVIARSRLGIEIEKLNSYDIGDILFPTPTTG